MTSDAQAVRAPALEMRGITKRYPGVVANDAIDLDVRPGEIHALLGENGAGKTTLMNILYGLARPDAGQILLDGTEVSLTGPSDAIARGISMVHQHFMLVPVLTVAENIVLGDETMTAGYFLDRREAHRRIVELGRAVRLRGRPGGQGRLAVGRLAAAGRDPQGALSQRPDPRPRRTDGGADAAGDRGDLRGPPPAGGRRPQHRLHQPQAVRGPRDRRPDHGDPARPRRRRAGPVGDERGGPRRADGRPRGVADRRPRRVSNVGRGRSRSKVWSSATIAARKSVHGIDLDVAAGEILGIAGVAGNGQDELVEAIVGLRKPSGGQVVARRQGPDRSQPARDQRGRRRVRAGRPSSLRAGAVVPHRRQPRPDELSPPPVRPRHPAQRRRDLDAWPTSGSPTSTSGRRRPMRRPGTLSGGNQQKVVIAREFARDLRLLVLDQPTRGLDVGSIEFIHRQAIAKRDAGTAVLLVSAELDEVLELSDRIAVIYRGRLVAVRDGRTADKNEIGVLMATGGRRRRRATPRRRRDRRMSALARPGLARPRPAGDLDRPVRARRGARHHRLELARHRAASRRVLRSMPTRP